MHPILIAVELLILIVLMLVKYIGIDVWQNIQLTKQNIVWEQVKMWKQIEKWTRYLYTSPFYIRRVRFYWYDVEFSNSKYESIGFHSTMLILFVYWNRIGWNLEYCIKFYTLMQQIPKVQSVNI